MNLYKIKVLHCAPRDSHESIEAYEIAEDDNEIYEIVNGYSNGRWSDAEKDGDMEDDLPYREWIMKHCGQLKDEDFSDAYYGITRYGWENMGEISKSDAEVLKRLKIIE